MDLDPRPTVRRSPHWAREDDAAVAKVAAHTPRRVVFVVGDGVTLIDVTGPLTVFCWSRDGRNPPYECEVVSTTGGMVTTETGVSITSAPLPRLDEGRPIDTLIIAGGRALEQNDGADRDLMLWLQFAAAHARRVCAVCSGATALAAAGLLDGRRAAAHWRFGHRLREIARDIEIDEDAIYVHDGGIWTSAGMTAGIDLALALVEEDLGRAAMMRVARAMVVFMRRPGGQSQFSVLLEAQAAQGGDVFEDLHRWMLENLKGDLSVERLAERVRMSPRNFARVYRARIGRTPAKTVALIRLEAARRALAEGREHLDAVAMRCGFATSEQMRETFVRHLKMTPREYRHRLTGAQAHI
jgi:transcriptional regulator GlxA family with amidase domain